jgi:hypothetical protein
VKGERLIEKDERTEVRSQKSEVRSQKSEELPGEELKSHARVDGLWLKV